MRLTLWHVGVLALALGGFGLTLCYRVQAEMLAAVDWELASIPRFIPGVPPPTFSEGSRSSKEAFGKGEHNGPFGAAVVDVFTAFDPHAQRRWSIGRPRILTPDGRSLLPWSDDVPWDRRSLAASAAGQEQYSTAQWEGESVRVFSAPIMRRGRVLAVFQVARPLTPQQGLRTGPVRTLGALLPLALLIAALGGVFLTDRVLRPVRQITQAAAQIGASDLSERLPAGTRAAGRGDDEFSELAATFNGMLGRLEQAFTQLAEALEQQRRLTADASHELRTPLTIVKAHTSLALQQDRSALEYRRALQAADRAADTTTRIVQELLLLARGDMGQLQLEQQPTPIGEILERAAAAFRSAEAPPIFVELPGPSPIVSVDPHHLLRVFTNLIENAVRHTPATGRVTLSVEEDETDVVVQVRDTGEGIPPEHLPHVRERFYRVDAARTRRRGGTGLGLAICQSLVEAHHGTLMIESVVGEGTTVTVRLPGSGTSIRPSS